MPLLFRAHKSALSRPVSGQSPRRVRHRVAPVTRGDADTAAVAPTIDPVPAVPAASGGVSAQQGRLLGQLTRREREVIVLVVRGATDREIARDLAISTNTVNEHIMAIKRKLGAVNRVSIAALYYGAVPYAVPAGDEGPSRGAPVEVAPAYASYVHRCSLSGHRS